MNIQEWTDMKPKEREAYFYTVIGIAEKELARMIAEFEFDYGKSPNAIFLSYSSLAKIPQRIKKVLGLVIIPIDEKPETYRIAEVDPWDKRWEHLFYS